MIANSIISKKYHKFEKWGGDNMSSLQEKFTSANSRLNNELNYIIQAFINFYGKKHRDYIVSVLQDLKIIWYEDIKFKEGSEISDYIVSSLSEDQINAYLKKYNKKCFSQSAYIDEIDVLVLPLSYDITHIIHEINHKVSSHILSLEPLKIISGVCTSVEKDIGVIQENSDLNEAINQKMTLEILDELRKLGLEIQYSTSWQENMFPLINLFYESFKEILKDTYISGDIVSFIKIIGAENYSEFSQRIFMKGFRLKRSLIKGEIPIITEEDVKEIESIVTFMQNFTCEAKTSEDKRKI